MDQTLKKEKIMAWDHVLKAFLATFPCLMRGCPFNNSGKCFIKNLKKLNTGSMKNISVEVYLNQKCGTMLNLKKDDYYFYMAHQTIDDAPLFISSEKEFEINLAKELLIDKGK